jgi:hypothetical protein
MVPVGCLLIGDDHAPIDPAHVAALVAGEKVDDRLIEVEPVSTHPPVYAIVNGRHRFLAAVLAGERRVACALAYVQ